MAQLVGLCDGETIFDRRQMPVEESGIKMVMQFEQCGDCVDTVKQKKLEWDQFYERCKALSHDELAAALMATSKDVFNHLSQSVTCVGCRRSVENLFNELVNHRYRTIEPLVVTSHSELSVLADVHDTRTLFCLFYVHGPRQSAVIETVGKGKSKKRCNLHSLDTHKVKSPSLWSDIWAQMSADCRAAVLNISCPKFEETLSSYLTKHRFCVECRAKVMLAYNILIGEHPAEEKGYCKRLFDKLQAFNNVDGVRHIKAVVLGDKDCSEYIKMLISMAEPELTGMNRRDRHAKTLDIAQEEVLTCLGIHIYDRLHKIGQRLKQEEQTFKLLFSLGVETLKKNFEMAVESKQGVSNLERMCEEIEEEERMKEQRKEMKRLKKKRRKAQAKSERENLAEVDNQLEMSNHCECSSTSIVGTKPLETSKLAQCDNHSTHCSHSNINPSPPSHSLNNNNDSPAAGCNHSLLNPHHHHHHHHHHHSNPADALHHCQEEETSPGCQCPQGSEGFRGSEGSRVCRNSDCGYGSEVDGCDHCSSPSSNDGSDICSDGLCMHDGEAGDLTCSDCQSVGGSPERKFAPLNQINSRHPQSYANDHQHACPTPKSLGSLEEMFANALSCENEEDDDGECGISQEDILQFQQNRSLLQQQRLELRENLKRRFENLQRQQVSGSPAHSPSLSPTPPHRLPRYRHM